MNQTIEAIPAEKLLDVREIPCTVKHGMIFGRYDRLKPGESFVLCNTHDPQPLRGKLEGLFPGGFSWEYLADGPEVWLIEIGKAIDQGPSGIDLTECGCSHGH